MSLTLLAPFALLGLGLLAIPIYLHLIDQRKVPRQDFPAMRFLLKAQKRLRRQSRVRDRLLLLARLLALLALCFAAAAPLFSYEEELPAGTDLGQNVVFLLDRSLSMGYAVADGDTLLDRAKARMAEVIRRLPEGSRVGLVVFDRFPEDALGGLSPDRQRALEVARGVKPGYGETDLRAAILAGVRDLVSSPEGGGDLYLLSDLTASSLPGAAPLELPDQLKGRVRMVVADLHEGPRPNRTVTGVEVEGGSGAAQGVKLKAKVRALGEGSEGEGALDLQLGAEVLSRGFVSLKAGEVSEKVFSVGEDTPLSGAGALRLEADALPADDSFFFRLSQRRDLKVLVIDGDPGMNLAAGESYFLERALSPSTASGSRITPVIVAPRAVPELSPEDIAVVFLLNVAEPGALAPRLQRYVEGGGALFIAGGENVTPERYNRALRGLLPATLGETISAAPDVTGEQAPSLAYPPVGHPVFRVFREAGAGVFGQTHFYKVIPTAPSLKPGAEVLLKFSTGLPALLGRRVGKGQVFFLASSLDSAWTDFPLKSIFLPFIQESVHHLAGNPLEDKGDVAFKVGEPVTLIVPEGTGPLTVVGPGEVGGKMTRIGEEVGESGGTLERLIFSDTARPGIYRITEEVSGGEGGKGPLLREDLAFVVNVSAQESDLSPLDLAALRAVVPEVPVVVEGQGSASDKTVTVERSSKLAQPLLWGMLLFMIAEGLLMSRRRTVKRGEGDPRPEPEAASAAEAS